MNLHILYVSWEFIDKMRSILDEMGIEYHQHKSRFSFRSELDRHIANRNLIKLKSC